MHNELDPVLNSPVRLAVVSTLIKLKQADFKLLLETTGATQGNLSIQIQNLAKAGYVESKKSYKNNYPYTVCKITEKGRKAFEKYVADIKKYLHL